MLILNTYINITGFRLQSQASMDLSFSFPTENFHFEKRSKFRKFWNFQPALIFEIFGILRNAAHHQIKGHKDSYILQGFSKIPKFSYGFEFSQDGNFENWKIGLLDIYFWILTSKYVHILQNRKFKEIRWA